LPLELSFFQPCTGLFEESVRPLRPPGYGPGSNHPVIWKFIEGIRTIRRGRDADYEQMIAEKFSNQKLLKYIKADERILNIIKQFDSRAPLEYLRDPTHNYDTNKSFIMFSNF